MIVQEQIEATEKFYIPVSTHEDERYTIDISESTYPVVINGDIGHVDDFTYSNKYNGHPLLRKGNKLYLEVGEEFLKHYVDADKMDSDFNVTRMSFQEALSKEINYGNVCLNLIP